MKDLFHLHISSCSCSNQGESGAAGENGAPGPMVSLQYFAALCSFPSIEKWLTNQEHLLS